MSADDRKAREQSTRTALPLAPPCDWRRRCEVMEQELHELVSALAHDLRAPLRAVDGFGRVLLERCASGLNDEGKDYFRRMREGAAQMSRYIEALVRLARATSAENRPRMVDLAALARPVIDSLRGHEPSRQVEVVVSGGLLSTVDPPRARCCSSACCPTPGSSPAIVRTLASRSGRIERSGEAIFFVRDNGCGFDTSRANRLFLPFSGARTAEQPSSYGIGLAIARRIVQRQGGRIWAESAADQGATFFFTLASRAQGELPAA